MLKKMRNQSFVWFISITMITIIMIISTINGFTLKKRLEDDLLTEYIKDTTIMAKETETFLTVAFEVVNQMTNTPLLGDYISYYHATGEKRSFDRFDEVVDHLQRILYDNEELWLTWVGAEGINDLLINDPTWDMDESFNYATRPWRLSMLRIGTPIVLTEPYIDAVTGYEIVSIVAPYYEDGELKGVYGIDVTITTITDFINSYIVGDTGFAVLVTDTGDIVSEEGDLTFMNDAERTFFENKLESISDEIMGNNQISIKGVLYVMMYETISDTNWKIITFVPEEEIYINNKLVGYNNIMSIAMIVGIILIGILFIIGRRNFKEIRNTNKEIEDFLRNETERLEILVEEKTGYLEQTTRELMESEKLASLGRLVAGVAHEINTPLGISVTAASFLADTNDTAYSQVEKGSFTKTSFIEYMKTVADTTNLINRNLTRTVDLVTRFKKISINQSCEIKTKIKVKKYIEDVFYTMKHEYKHLGLEIAVTADERIEILSYPGAFSQIFTNLLMNSLVHGYSHIEDMEGKRINLVIEKSKAELIMRYSDNGVGFAKDVKNHIFEPFYTTAMSTGGSGLGMHIVYNLVKETLNGKIVIDEAVEQGAGFTIIIPIEEGHNTV